MNSSPAMQRALAPTVLILDDDASILMVLSRSLKQAGYEVRTTTDISEANQWVRQGVGDLMLTDVTMPSANGIDALKEWHALRPSLPVMVMSAHHVLLHAARAQEYGAVEFLPKPFDLSLLTARIKHHLADPSRSQAIASPEGHVRISSTLTLVGASPAMQEIYRTLTRLISNDLTVMLTGESGTGKELIAQALHQLGKRKAAPFVAINMAAIPKELMESALFGHEKGAFTGAHQRQLGAFEKAQGGTLFLDEIGDMPADAQTRLLRVLQQGEFTPIGSSRTIKTDLRIIAATHHDLKALVAEGRFRDDLYYRLHVVPLAMPPLRARREDIALLTAHFVSRAEGRGLPEKHFSQGALEALAQYSWPGNVRELEHTVYRLLALVAQHEVSAAHVQQELRGERTMPSASQTGGEGLEAQIDAHLEQYFAGLGSALPSEGLHAQLLPMLERPLILHTLRATAGNQIKAAELLGLNRNTLRKKMRELGIEVKQLMQGGA